MDDPELLAALALARRKIAEVWPVKGPAQEVHDADGHYATELVATYRPPFGVQVYRHKVWIPSKDIGSLVVKKRRGFTDLVD